MPKRSTSKNQGDDDPIRPQATPCVQESRGLRCLILHKIYSPQETIALVEFVMSEAGIAASIVRR